jgi:hypothetical protein
MRVAVVAKKQQWVPAGCGAPSARAGEHRPRLEWRLGSAPDSALRGAAEDAGRRRRGEAVGATRTRRGLWVAAFFALPVPIWLLGPGAVPPARLAELGLAALAVGLAEDLRGVVGWTALIFLGQALVYGLALWAVCAVLARARGRVRGVLLTAAALLVVAACAFPIYRSPYHATRAETTLLQVYR